MFSDRQTGRPFRRLRFRASAIPAARVVAATADIQRSTRTMVEAAGARGLINKPLIEEAVLKMVADALKD